MTTFADKVETSSIPTAPTLGPTSKGKLFVKWVTSTDHKTIGYLYLITSFVWFLVAGVLALMLRAELARTGLQ